MVSDTIQPLNAIGPMCEGKNDGNGEEDQAKKDYREGRNYFTNGDYTQAVISFHNALLGFEEKNDVQGVANASDRLGDTCMAREEYLMAVGHFQKAAEICEQEDDTFSLTALHKKMATAYRALGEPAKAFELLFDILEHYHIVQNPKGVVEILGVIGELYEETGDNKKAADTYRTISGIHANFKHTRLAQEFADKAAELE